MNGYLTWRIFAFQGINTTIEQKIYPLLDAMRKIVIIIISDTHFIVE